MSGSKLDELAKPSSTPIVEPTSLTSQYNVEKHTDITIQKERRIENLSFKEDIKKWNSLPGPIRSEQEPPHRSSMRHVVTVS